MKALLTSLLTLIVLAGFSQEIEHRHSLFHAMTENKGQWAEQVLFQSRSQKHNIWIQQHGFLYDIRDYSKLQHAHLHPGEATEAIDYRQTVVAAHFVGSNEVTQIRKHHPSQHYYNYFIGNDRSKWVSGVYSYNQAVLEDFYTGIDMKIFDDEARFKYELWCSPGSDAKQIAIDYKGAEQLRIDEKGNLVVTTPLGDLIEQAPVAYQILNGKISEVSCAFELNGNRVTFALGNYSKHATLVIDPTLVFATYCGSVTDNFGMTATYGYDGTAYSAGTIYGNAYPTPDPNAYDVASNFTVANIGNPVTTDAFLSKYSADGTTMLWTTFLGGGDNTQGTETSHSLICDRLNNVYIFGVTSSLDFPVMNGYQASHGGGTPLSVNFNGSNFGNTGTDIYIAKFSSDGHTLLGSTYMGGSLNDGVNFKVTSGNYNSVAAYDSLTTNYGDQFRGEIMIDSLGNCIVASCSRSVDFPVQNAFQPTLAGQQDGVIFKLSSDLSALQWSSYFGGANNDACYSVKIDSSYNIVFAGGTSSTSLPGTTGSVQPSYQGGKTDGFVGKLTPNGQVLVRSSYIGTPNYDQAFFVEIDRLDNVFLLGQSAGGTFPIINATGYANSSQFVAKLTPDLSAIQNSTIFGNGNTAINISPSAFLVDICGNIYISGWGANILQATPLNGMPVTSNAFQSTPANGFDFYLAVLDRDFDGLLYGSYLGGNAAQEHVDGGTSRFDKNGVVYQSVCGGCGGNSDFPTTADAWSNNNLSTNCNNLIFKFDFELIPEAEFFTDDLLGCADYVVTFQNSSSASDSYLWDFGNGDTTSVIFNPTVTYTEPGIYFVTLTVTDSICLLTDTAEITIVVAPAIQLQASNDTIMCTPLPLTLVANSFGTAETFIWSTSDQFTDTLNLSTADSTLAVTPTETTTYYVMAANQGCSEIDSVQVFFVSGSLDISGNDSICIGESTTLTASISIPGVTFDYVWTPADVLTPTAQDNVVTATPATATWIYVTANGSNGCFDEDSILVQVGNLGSAVTATADPDIVLPGDPATLTASPSGFSYSWSPVTGLSNPNGQITQAVVEETTDYTVTVTDGICSQSSTVTVKVMDVACKEPFLYVPNAFSPNGDNENDVLYVRSAITTEILFRVFDRWGELIFESTSLSDGWDGTFRGKAVDPDTYDYYLEAICKGGDESIIKGNITLIR
jgi:gliding motility-associated-like protein